MTRPTLTIDTASEPGAYAKALRYPHSIAVSDFEPERDTRRVAHRRGVCPPDAPAVVSDPFHVAGDSQ